MKAVIALIEDAKERGDVYGCLFCQTGKEDTVVLRLRQLSGLLEAFCVKQAQHQSRAGVKSVTEKVMLPGYVFFTARPDMNTDALNRQDYVIRLLQYEAGWELRGRDLEFALWAHGHGGMIGLSKAYRLGDRVVITDGPLKEMEGVITKLDKHNRNGQVCVDFGGRQIKVWLAFEYVTEETR